MDASDVSLTPEAPKGEAFARPSETHPQQGWSLLVIKKQMGETSHSTLEVLTKVFGIQESAVGLMALLHELTKDLAALRALIPVPAWVGRLDTLYAELKSISTTDHVRDLVALQSQPRSALRTFLTPFAPVKPNQHRAIRAIRALAALQLLAKKEHLIGPLADQLGRCLKGRSLQCLGPEHISPDRMREVGRGLSADSPEARLLTLILDPLELPLPNPFAKSVPAGGQWLGKVAPGKNATRLDSGASEDGIGIPSDQSVPDPLNGFLVEEAFASVKVFSGIPDLYRGLLPFELESTLSGMRAKWRGETQDECLAAWLTLLTRVMPQHFDRVPLHADEGAGLWIDLERGYVCWNLDEILSSHKKDKPFLRSADDRYILIPLPLEILRELRCRFQPGGKRTLASLFPGKAKRLGVTTKRFLRGLSITSHRPTLSRLSYSWARYVLTLCRDEVYASALGIDFTVGTPSNFNYVTLRGERIRAILSDAYRRVGFSGELGGEDLPDLQSRRLPAQEKVAALVEHSLRTIADVIAGFPKRAAIARLKAAHNQIALALYGVFKLVTGGRALKEETVTYSRLDLASGLTELCDKRTAPYHERRVICLPPTLRQWTRAYVGWLRLVAYRLANEDRCLSEAITATLDTPWHGDRVPLFFRFEGKDILPLGSDDLVPAFKSAGLKNNTGRHFVDAIFRGRGLDSSAIMGWMGRGYPGQEIYGRWSVVIPLDALCECASAIEDWLGQLSLPTAPILAPRAPQGIAPRDKRGRYVPALLCEVPDALAVKMAGTVEPCPYQENHVLEASLFPRLFQAWRSAAPPVGWPGVALSLVLEDGVLLEEELLGVLREMQQGVVYRHQRQYFVDARTPNFGIRRVWLSAVTIRLLHKIRTRGPAGGDHPAIEAVARKFVSRALPAAGAEGIRFVQRCLQAFLFFQMPALLYGWMRGDLFARTARPQTVAREIFECCEHPSFEQRFSRRERWRFNDFAALHRKANEALASGAADATVLANFDRDLAEIHPNYDPDSLEWWMVGYARYLCQNQATLASVSRYLSACRPFLQRVVAGVAENGWDHIEWRALVSQCLGSEGLGADKAPDRAAINHCLAWLGIDERIYRRSGPPPSAFAYADRMTEREGLVAVRLLRSKQKMPGDAGHRASLALALLLAVELRWDELACLRLEDLCLASGRAHLVVTRESGAALKSLNAPRVVTLDDPGLLTELQGLHAQRAARFPLDSRVPFFGDETEYRAHDSLDQVHDLIAEALWCATGSGALRVHDTRAAGLTRKVGRWLDPEFREMAGGALDSRQALFRVCTQAGHVSPGVSIENYVHDLDVRRREWLDRILARQDVHTRPAFAEGVTGIREATYRQRAVRSSSPLEEYDFFEGFDASESLETGATVRELADLVVPGLTVVADLAEQYHQTELVGAGIYIGLNFLAESSESARLAAGLPVAAAKGLETKLAFLQREHRSALRGHAAVSRDEFIDAALKSGLVVAMSATAPHVSVLRRLMAAVDVVGGPWELVDPADLLDAAAWLDSWRAAGIEPRLELKSLGQSRLDDYWLQRCSRIGLRARIYPASHFRRGVAGLVKFRRVGTGDTVSQFRASPHLACLVTTSLFALGLLMKGNNDEKKTDQCL